MLFRFDFGNRIKLSLGPAFAEKWPCGTETMGGTLRAKDISFSNDVISLFFLPHLIVCVPATWFGPCDHILQRAHNIIITTLQKYLENYKTISLLL